MQPAALAAEDLPQGACSDEFDADAFLRPSRDARTVTAATTTTVEVRSSAGRLRAHPPGRDYGWVRALPLADDCHSCNVLLHPGPRGLVLLVVRPVRQGEPLLLWLSEPLLAVCAVPFLSPCNIQGENRYVCHRCGRLYGVPNPLKIHLALSCDRLDMGSLWARLKDLPLAPPAPELRRHPGLLPSAGGGSAFRPYGKGSPDARVPPSPLALVAGTRGSLAATVEAYHQQAAVMETLVSNLGRSRQGHLCIYCGKVYSRKYGLKIHIRTHTGYKPLSCKVCLRPFGDPSNLNKHVRLHTGGETPYKCEQCGKVLVRRRDLDRHLRSRHSPTDPAATTGQQPA
ncbi:zinc finger protein 846 [Bacillus rossius redtenbacheri]|uniref:zinc finger protein 846 n=1 Tax=Bacillus rossius redtenbacheri TaxID=93214 RepID=UPI002FDDB632